MNLEDQIEKRREEAKEKNIAGKTKYICLVLGKYDYEVLLSGGGGLSGDPSFVAFENYKYTRKKLYFELGSVIHQDGSGGKWVEVGKKRWFSNKRVYYRMICNTCKLLCYKPGKWENTLDSLYNQAKKVQREEVREKRNLERLRRKEKEDRLKERFEL